MVFVFCVIPALLLFAGCGSPVEDTELTAGTPVILISIDTLRSDRLPAYGYQGIETPAFDHFASEAILFESAWTHYPLTLPSHASLLTGLLPPDHGVRDNLGFRLPDQLETLPERMQEAGYRTIGVVSSSVLRKETGIAQGFDLYDDDMPGTGRFAPPHRSGDQTLDRLEEILADHADDAAPFIFLHLFDPHTPREAPEPYATRYTDPYDAEVAYTDHVLGRLEQVLTNHRLFEDSLIVLLSDHGEGLGDHVETEHGIFLYRETLQVPLMVRFPGGRGGGRRESRPAFLSDLMPTILDLLKLRSDELPGVNLFGQDTFPEIRTLYGETWFGKYQYGLSELRTALRGNLHYIEAPRPELYDLETDFLEQDNLIHTQDPPPSLLDTLKATERGTISRGEITEDERSRLASLGYVGGGTDKDDYQDGPDPKDHIETIESLWENVRKVGNDPTHQAEQNVLEALPKLGIRNEPLYRTLANNMLEAGRPITAGMVMEIFQDSPDPATIRILGQIDLELGRLEQAAARFGQLLDLSPNDPDSLLGLGLVNLSAGRATQAEKLLREAVRLDPALAEAWNGLGVARAGAGDIRGAVELWRKAVELDPSYDDASFNLARGLAILDSGSNRPD